jgi:hypothetical protein
VDDAAGMRATATRSGAARQPGFTPSVFAQNL